MTKQEAAERAEAEFNRRWVEYAKAHEKPPVTPPGQPQPLIPLCSGSVSLAVGVGTYDSNGNPKGSGWW